MKNQFLVFLVLVTTFTMPLSIRAQSKLESFRSTNQKVALVGWYSEFVEPSVNDELLRDARRLINRYSRTFDQSAIEQFTFVANPNNQYFRPVESSMDEAQKEFLQKSAKDNQIDIFVLGNLRESPTGLDLELQLYDARIDTLSAIESAKFRLNDRQLALENLMYKTFNYVDRDGFVHPTPQDFLQPPVSMQSSTQSDFDAQLGTDEFLSIEDLSSGRLAGSVSIGGEKTPFWERWWFWTAIFGGLTAAGGLSYYFLVVNQPSNQADVTFTLP